MTPIVSVIMPLYNKEEDVGRSVMSVLCQTVGDFELIIVNDGSKDKSLEVVQSFPDPRIRLVNQLNQGVSAARNRGITEAGTDLITFIDADDEWMPDFLGTIFYLRDKFPNCEVLATNYVFRRSNNYFRRTFIRGLPDGFKEGILSNYFSIAAKSDPPLSSSAIAINKKAITSIGGFPAGIASGEDLLTWAKLALNYKIAYSINPKAYNWEPVTLSDRPGRVPQIPDVVGQEFIRLLNDANSFQVKELKNYIVLWHQMRASIFVRLGKRKEAIDEVKKMARYSKWNPKLYVFFAVALLPRKICGWGMRAKNYYRYYRYRKSFSQSTIYTLI